MCGIVGFLNCGSPSQLGDATSLLAHRGPDSHGTQWFPELNSGLGHRRLSIIDLSDTGKQPLYHAPSGNWIVFNGELFNYQEIKIQLQALGYRFQSSSDTEVVVAAYFAWGTDCLSRFNGMFAFAILNEASGDLFIARDRLGIKPLYYYQHSGKLVFASEIKAIIASKEYYPAVDFQALQTPAHYQIGPYTGFKNILKLPAACYLKAELDGKFEISRYWNLVISEESPSWYQAAERLDFLIHDSTRLQMISDVPVGCLLSGGLDSSLISVLMQRHSENPLHTFTIRFEADDLKRQGNSDDAYYAALLAKKHGFIHHETTIHPDIADLLPKLVWHLDEPVADPAAINTFLISEQARKQGIYVLLSGMGADEVFAGYRAQYACTLAEQINRYFPHFSIRAFNGILQHIPEKSSKLIRSAKRMAEIASLPPFERYLKAYNSALGKDLYQSLFLDAPSFEEGIYYKTQAQSFETSNGKQYLNRVCFNDTRHYLTDHNLNYTDKSSMAIGVETRPPLIDHRIVEFMFSLSSEFRIRGREQKALLRSVARKYLPELIMRRPKAPFSAPLRSWINRGLRPMTDELLSEKSIRNRGLYNYKIVNELLNQHRSGLRDHSQLIWRMMVNEVWFRTFFDSSIPKR